MIIYFGIGDAEIVIEGITDGLTVIVTPLLRCEKQLPLKAATL